MRLVSFLFVVHVLLLNAAPAFSSLAEAVCCAHSCEQESEAPLREAQPEPDELCNPFSCAGCCLVLQHHTKPANITVQAIEQGTQQPWPLLLNPPLQPQYGIWHPPRSC